MHRYESTVVDSKKYQNERRFAGLRRAWSHFRDDFVGIRNGPVTFIKPQPRPSDSILHFYTTLHLRRYYTRSSPLSIVSIFDLVFVRFWRTGIAPFGHGGADHHQQDTHHRTVR
jgi:hypothetical protein